MKVYQIKLTGRYELFPDSTASLSSKEVYRNYPTEEQISKFIENCTNTENPFANVDKRTIDVKVLELELI